MSKVYITKADEEKGPTLYHRLEKLFKEAQINQCIEEGDVVAIKMHMGEKGGRTFIHPVIVRRIVELVKNCGGFPFVTDTTTLYKHARHTLFDYLSTAKENGFTPETLGCPVIIADGFKNSGTYVEIENPYQLKKIKVAEAIYESDAMICLAHITLHPEFPMAASIKNIAMGCVTKEGKIKMHTSSAKPSFNSKKCILCKLCLRFCPGGCFSLVDGKISFDPSKCVNCADCISFCKGGALGVAWQEVVIKNTEEKSIDAFKAVLNTFKKNKVGYINVGINITKSCDCMGRADVIVQDIGVLASLDPLAIDKASYDLIVSSGYDMKSSGWRVDQMVDFWEICEKAGIGEQKYDLIYV